MSRGPGFRIRVHLIQGYYDQKIVKNLQRKNIKKFLDQKLQFTYPYATIKDVQVTKEAFSSQKRTSSTSIHKMSYFFLLLWVMTHFCPPGSGSETLQRAYIFTFKCQIKFYSTFLNIFNRTGIASSAPSAPGRKCWRRWSKSERQLRKIYVKKIDYV